MQNIDVGFKKFQVTTQAYIAFISLIVILFTGLIAGFMTNQPIYVIALTIVTNLIVIPLVTYAVNCLRVGKCVKLSWFYAIIYIIMAVFYVILMISTFFINGSVDNQPTTIIYSGTFSKK